MHQTRYLLCCKPNITILKQPYASPLERNQKIFAYLKGTVNHGISYHRSADLTLLAYTDADYAGNLDDRKSTSGAVFTLTGGPVAWFWQRQHYIALSKTESEYIAASVASKEITLE